MNIKWHYAVAIGREPGIYLSWAKCSNQVSKFPGACYQKFPTEEEAVAFVREKIPSFRREGKDPHTSKSASQASRKREISSLDTDSEEEEEKEEEDEDEEEEEEKKWAEEHPSKKNKKNKPNKKNSPSRQNGDLQELLVKLMKLTLEKLNEYRCPFCDGIFTEKPYLL